MRIIDIYENPRTVEYTGDQIKNVYNVYLLECTVEEIARLREESPMMTKALDDLLFIPNMHTLTEEKSEII